MENPTCAAGRRRVGATVPYEGASLTIGYACIDAYRRRHRHRSACRPDVPWGKACKGEAIGSGRMKKSGLRVKSTLCGCVRRLSPDVYVVCLDCGWIRESPVRIPPLYRLHHRTYNLRRCRNSCMRSHNTSRACAWSRRRSTGRCCSLWPDRKEWRRHLRP